MTVRPSGTVTFLFTDIEGSTRRWEADPEAMRVALAAHDDVLRSAVDGHGGWLFKHTGDGVCAAFGSPRAAIDAAVDAQRRLGLPVRMGIGTGEAELRGNDYFGPALNRASRVMTAGHGGQILVAASTAALVDGVELEALGLALGVARLIAYAHGAERHGRRELKTRVRSWLLAKGWTPTYDETASRPNPRTHAARTDRRTRRAMPTPTITTTITTTNSTNRALGEVPVAECPSRHRRSRSSSRTHRMPWTVTPEEGHQNRHQNRHENVTAQLSGSVRRLPGAWVVSAGVVKRPCCASASRCCVTRRPRPRKGTP